MKAKKNYKLISISDFQFTQSGYGCWRVRFISRNTGYSWETMVEDMDLIDSTKNEDFPKPADLIRLKRLCKDTGLKYDKNLNPIYHWV